MSTTRYDYLIIGSGFAGLCAAIQLKRAGLHNFAILERNAGLGGTWYNNHYPGAACDVQSHLYSFSFEPMPGWSRMFSPQQEILAYMQHCAAKYGLQQHFIFNVTVANACFNEEDGMWTVKDAGGNNYIARIVISCTGGLSQPALPNLPGLHTFKGKMFHTANWDSSYSLKNKTVAVIGTGASAIQVVPAIAGEVKELFLFQRTPPWILPKPDRPISRFEQKLFKRLSFMQGMFRGWLYWTHELMAAGFISNNGLMKLGQKMAERHLKKAVPDEALRARLTPKYTMGCKRVLISNNYYPALQRSNVHLVTDAITAITAEGILTPVKNYTVDTIVLATGFHAADGVLAFDITGRNGISLTEAWQNGSEAYLGTSVSGFPNLFLVVGPNTGLGHSSMLLMIEAQVNYIMEGIKTMIKSRLKFADLKPAVQKIYNDDLQARLQKSVWQSGGCVSWYQNKSGKNVTLWPGYTFSFINRTKKFRPEKYELVK